MIHEKDLHKMAVNLAVRQNRTHSAAVELYNNLQSPTIQNSIEVIAFKPHPVLC